MPREPGQDERDMVEFINEALNTPTSNSDHDLDISLDKATTPRKRGQWVQGNFVEEILPGQSPIVPAPTAPRPRPRKVTGRDYYMCWCGETFPTEEAIMTHTHRDGRLRIGWRSRAT